MKQHRKYVNTVKNTEYPQNLGMTLVEIMVTLVITAMVLTVLGSIYLSSTGYFAFFSEKREAQMIVNTIFDTVKEDIVFATDIYVSYDALEKPGYTAQCFSCTKKDESVAGNPGRLYSYDANEDRYTDNYGEIFYEKGILTCSITNTTATSVTFLLSMHNKNNELLYERERTFDIINMSKDPATSTVKFSSGQLNQTYSNENKDLYIYTRATKKIIQPSPMGSELLIWRDMKKLFSDNIAEDALHYSAYTQGAQVPIRNANALLEYEYLQSKGKDELLTISSQTIQDWGLSQKLRELNYYMVVYQYVNNTVECDALMYASAQNQYDTSADTQTIQLLFMQEENAWFYFEVNDVLAAQQCLSLEVWNENSEAFEAVEGFPVAKGSIVRYRDESGESITTIQSSYSCKAFIKKYGRMVAKENETIR